MKDRQDPLASTGSARSCSVTEGGRRGLWIRLAYVAAPLCYTGGKALQHDGSFAAAWTRSGDALSNVGALGVPLLLGVLIGFTLADRAWAATLGAVCLALLLALSSIMGSPAIT